MIQMEMTFKITATGLITSDWMLQLVLQQHILKKTHTTSIRSNKFWQKLDIQNEKKEALSCNIWEKEIKRETKNEGIK